MPETDRTSATSGLLHRGADSVRQRLGRVWVNAPLALQCGLAAGLAWYIAAHLLRHASPFFAPIAAVIVLGASTGHRLLRTVELVLGVAVGIVVGDVLIAAIGSGPIQLGIVVTLAVGAALFLGSGALIVNQAAASAVLITTLYPPSAGIYYDRWIDTLVGGAVAFVVHALLVPIDPLTAVRRNVRPVLDALTNTLARVAVALREHDLEGAEQALAGLRETEPTLVKFQESVLGAAETVAVSPVRWDTRGQLGRYRAAAPHLDHAVRNSRVLARHSASALRNSEQIPVRLPEALDAVVESIVWLQRELDRGQPPEAARGRAIQAIRLAYAAVHDGPELSTTAAAAQIRSVAFDILLASGLDELTAREFAQHARRQMTPEQ
jgi:uncharacterized membrane protein YgaE (UPF0421/DUF939 family)